MNPLNKNFLDLFVSHDWFRENLGSYLSVKDICTSTAICTSMNTCDKISTLLRYNKVALLILMKRFASLPLTQQSAIEDVLGPLTLQSYLLGCKKDLLLCQKISKIILKTPSLYHSYSPQKKIECAVFANNIDEIKALLEEHPISMTTRALCIEHALHTNAKETLNALKQGYKLSNFFHIACQNGHINIVNKSLETNYSIDKKDKYNNTPLYYACSFQHVEIVKMLLAKGADPNEFVEDENTVFFSVCQTSSPCLEIVKALLEHNADVDACDEDGESPLLIACEIGNLAFAQLLIAHEARVNLCNYEGYSPLWIACFNGHSSIVDCLLENGADVTFRTIDQKTALHAACEKGHADIVISLLNKQADVNACDENGFSPLHLACNQQNKQLVEILIQSQAKKDALTDCKTSPLHIACFRGNVEIALLFLKEIVDNDARDQCGRTFQHLACEAGHPNILLELIKRKANLDVVDKFGRTLLYTAFCNSHIDIIDVLLKHGIDPDAVDDKGTPFIHSACFIGKLPLVQVFINNGVNLETKDENGNTPLIVACQLGHYDIVKLLLETGVNVTAKSENNKSPLFWATCRGHLNVVKLLCKYDLKKSHYVSPLQLALHHNKIDIVLYLLSLFEDVNEFSNDTLREVLIKNRDGASQLTCQFGIEAFTSFFTDLEAKEHFQNLFINKDHYTNRKEMIEIPEKRPENIELEMVESMFDTINFENENDPCYVNPDALYDDENKTTKEKLRINLTSLINNVKNRQAFLATPRQDDIEGLEVYYSRIEICILSAIEKVQKEEDPITKRAKETKIALKLAVAGGHCGDRYTTTSLELFDEMVNEVPDTFERIVYSTLDSARKTYLSQCIQTTESDTHEYSTLLRRIGAEFSIPGWKIVEFTEPFDIKQITKDEAKRRFYVHFTFQNILHSIEQELFQQDVQEKFKHFAIEVLSELSLECKSLISRVQDRLHVLLEQNQVATSVFDTLNDEFEDDGLYIFATQDVNSRYSTDELIRKKVLDDLYKQATGMLFEPMIISNSDLEHRTISRIKKEVVIRMLVHLKVFSQDTIKHLPQILNSLS